jgi:hypothetical protein
MPDFHVRCGIYPLDRIGNGMLIYQLENPANENTGRNTPTAIPTDVGW